MTEAQTKGLMASIIYAGYLTNPDGGVMPSKPEEDAAAVRTESTMQSREVGNPLNANHFQNRL